MRLVGIDPGLRCTGYGIIDYERSHPTVVQYGTIRTKKMNSFPERLQVIYDDITEMLGIYKTDEFAIEEAIYSKNARTALQLGHVRGVAILAAMHANIPVNEYSAKKIKMALTGRGSATKEQVQYMVTNILNLDKIPGPTDASDALACAICHQQQIRFSI
jgi:crossover junction endodeoxyribonuclease RuvC